MIASLSRPCPVAGTSLEALCHVRRITLPLVRARGAHGKTAAHGPKAKRRLSIGGEPSGSGRLRATRRLSIGGAPRRPLAKGKANGLLTLRVQTVLQCAPRARTQGGALAKHLAKRFQKRAGTGAVSERWAILTSLSHVGGRALGQAHRKSPVSPLKLFSTFFSRPLAQGGGFCYTCTRQQWAGPSEEARAFPIPLRIERKER